LFENNTKFAWKYDLVFETWWGGYGHNNKYDTKTLIKANRPDYTKQHEIEHNMELVRRVGFKDETQKQYVYVEDVKTIANKKIIGIHSGSFKGVWQKKQWNKFSELIQKLIDKNYYVINFGTKEDSINENIINKYWNAAGELTLQGTIDNIKNCNYFIANDSGLMHIADALNIPLIALFGGTLVTKNRPVNKHSHVLVGNMDCQPCQYTQRFAECKENKCLSNITVNHILNYMDKLNWTKNT